MAYAHIYLSAFWSVVGHLPGENLILLDFSSLSMVAILVCDSHRQAGSSRSRASSLCSGVPRSTFHYFLSTFFFWTFTSSKHTSVYRCTSDTSLTIYSTATSSVQMAKDDSVRFQMTNQSGDISKAQSERVIQPARAARGPEGPAR